MKALFFCILLALSVSTFAGWEFSHPVEVGGNNEKQIYHHLESSNRSGLAESDGRVAIVWEDNREGIPLCWTAIKNKGSKAFRLPQAISNGECYEPSVIGIGSGRFVLAWEEDARVWVSLADNGKALSLSKDEAGQLTLARIDEQNLFAVWAEKAGNFRRLMLARISVSGNGLKVEWTVPVEDRQPNDEQAYPSMAVNSDGSVTLVWEDRRFKHTSIMAAHSRDGKLFSPPYRLTDIPQARARTLGAGMGSMRPTLGSCGPSCMVASWLDKRDFLSGYDVYAAFSQNGGKFFGRNLKVQDSFGENIAQWHASISANQKGRVVAVWDDDRDGTSDIWLSDWTGSAFSDNLAVPGAAGPGAQVDPIIYLDDSDTLHIAWLERTEANTTKLKYANASWKD